MFIIQLKFSEHKSKASQFMAGHKEWIQQGFDDGIFLVAGSLQPNRGGAIIAQDTSLPAIQERVNRDPFLVEDIVTAEIIEITPSRTDERLNFLLE